MAQENFSSIYWLGGFHTGGRVRGVNWLRGRWTGGSWEKGNFYSVDLTVDWEGPYKNLWSKWLGGTWRSNSQNYGFDNWSLENEWSIWHGGTWESARYTSQAYTWQGPFTNEVNIYGDLTTYECDIPTGNALAKRSIYLPSPRSLWLGGQWLRGDFKGGIFACGAWHSLKWDPAQYEYLDNLFFLYGVPPQVFIDVVIDGETYQFIDNDNEGFPFDIYLYNDAEFFEIDLTVQYNESVSNFYQGAFVNSIWEGGTVLDVNTDPFNTLFGMSLDTETSRIQDDSGYFSNTGFLESNQILRRRRHGLNMIDYNQYYENSLANNLNQVLFINGNQYYMPNKLEAGGLYSTIWKRGKFQNGVFMYGQWYDYNDVNEFRTNYSSDLSIINTFANLQTNSNLPINWSVFEQGLFYSSIWFNGIWLARNNQTAQKTSAFSRSQWLTGYWAAAENNATTFSNDRKITNSEFWKSIWYTGIWEGGQMSMSVWNSFNPYNFNLTLDNTSIVAISTNINPWANIEENPMGMVSSDTFKYYDDNGDPTPEFDAYKNDIEKIDLIRRQPVEGFDFNELVIDNLDFFIEYEGTSGGYDPGPYDFELDEETGTSGLPLLYLYNNDEFFENDQSVNNIFLRYTGLVDNAASFWKNGTARGVVWNGGVWMTGVFKSYTFDDYPTYVTDRRTNVPVQLDWFDDNVITQSLTTKVQNAVWNRGLWYAGYFRGDAYALGVSAFVRNALVGLTLDMGNKFLISDDLLNGQYNSMLAEIAAMRPNNYASIFARKALRDTDVYFSMFNGQMLSGIHYDITKNGTNTPGFGTLAFPEDITLEPFGASFGKVTYDILVNPDAFGNPNPIIEDNANLSFNVKNTFNTLGVDLNIAEPFAYDDINIILAYNLTTQQYINMYYYNSMQTIVQAVPGGPLLSNYDIRHAASHPNAESEAPKWTDILPYTEAWPVIEGGGGRVPSTAQGSGQTEPYYDPTIPLPPGGGGWLDSGIGQ